MAFAPVFRRVFSPTFDRRAGSLWWLLGGVAAANAVAVYQPKGVASLAASYINLANPGTYDAVPGVAPTFAAATGWTFNGLTQWLRCPYTVDGYTDSIIVRFSDAGNGYLFGVASGPAIIWELSPSGIVYRLTDGSPGTTVAPGLTSGVIAMVAGQHGYRNGVAETGLGTRPVSYYWLGIGARTAGSNNNPQGHIAATIQAFAIYNTRLAAPQVAAISAAMAAL